MAYRQKRIRELQAFSFDLMESIADRMEERITNYNEKMDILAKCLEKLPEASRELISRRYLQEDTIPAIAKDLQKEPNSIRQILFRIKSKLIECVQLQIKAINTHARHANTDE
jgi:RNA polymerase sigma-70 factor (ECF subfamily)